MFYRVTKNHSSDPYITGMISELCLFMLMMVHMLNSHKYWPKFPIKGTGMSLLIRTEQHSYCYVVIQTNITSFNMLKVSHI